MRYAARRKEAKVEPRRSKIELYWPGDGRVFVNFWDTQRGEDVCCQILGHVLRADGNEIEELDMSEFAERVFGRIDT